MLKKFFISLAIMLFLFSACAPAATTTDPMANQPVEPAVETQTDDLMAATAADSNETPAADMDASATPTMSDDGVITPAFFDTSLTDVNTGETFRISDFSGKVVLVENLAMWCSNCKKQQDQVKLLHETLGVDSDLISIGFDVDPNENADDLKRYTESNGFDWIYAIPPQEVLTEISQLLGANFLNPPSTPIFVIDRKGGVHAMPFGVKSAEDLQAFIAPFLAEGM
ncbi:MAG: hypothetical protein HPY85_15465 [Anaerolineae bacterium]|nr:hypothetical protein [Anaerolineae bacterium]